MNVAESRQPALTDFIDLETLQSLQDGFAKLTGIATSIHDPDGRPITQPAGKSAFCALLASTPTGEAACESAHAEASGVAREAHEPGRHICHAELTQFVAPIMVVGRHLGTIILGGQPTAALDRKGLVDLGRRHGLTPAGLAAAAEELVPWRDAEIAPAAEFVQQLASTIARLCYQSHELRHRVDELAALRRVSSMLAGRVDLQEILDTATKTLVETMGLRAAGLRLLDEDTGELRIASAAQMSEGYFDKEPVLLTESPVDQEVLESGKTVAVENVQTDPRTYYKDRACKEGLVSALVTRLTSSGQRLGVLRAYMGRVHEFSPFDVSLLEAIASQVAAAIVNARLRRDAAEAEKLERQVRLAGEVQRRMIPVHAPDHSRYQFAHLYEPTSELGGDFYDFVDLPSGDLGLVIADVLGKGVPASLMMASARSALRAHAARVADISDLMAEVNQRLCQDTLIGEFVTAFYAVLSREGRRLTFCNAGHEPMVLLRRGTVRGLDVGGLVLGVDPEAGYEIGASELEPGDLLVFVTDGLTEALNYDGEAYGRARLHASIRLHGSMAPDMPVNLIAKQLLWDVRRFVGLAPQSDDMTLVVVRVH